MEIIEERRLAALFWRCWDLLERMQSPFPPPQGACGAFWESGVEKWYLKAILGSFLGLLGTIFGGLGVVLGGLGGLLGSSWGVLGRSWGSWGGLGRSWEGLGEVLCGLGAILGRHLEQSNF